MPASKKSETYIPRPYLALLVDDIYRPGSMLVNKRYHNTAKLKSDDGTLRTLKRAANGILTLIVKPSTAPPNENGRQLEKFVADRSGISYWAGDNQDDLLLVNRVPDSPRDVNGHTAAERQENLREHLLVMAVGAVSSDEYVRLAAGQGGRAYEKLGLLPAQETPYNG